MVRSMATDPKTETVPFGLRDVDPADKPALVADIFDSVASRYDLMNDLMTGGIQRLWKRAMVAALAPKPGDRLLDLAGGTGDIAARILDHHAVDVTVCDLTPTMLEVGRWRAWDRGRIGMPQWVCGSGLALPFSDRYFNVCTIAFGLRNFARIGPGLAEIARVLRPGGRFLCLEFSPEVAAPLAPLYGAFSDRIIPALGKIVADDRDAYTYLVESIRRFPPPDTLSVMLADAGFAGIRARKLSGGIVALHSAWRV